MSNSKITALKKELETIREMNNGFLSAEKVVEHARKKSSVLHSQFCWDDTEAAHKYRIQQAHLLIRTIKVEIIPNKKTQEKVRVREYVSLPNDRSVNGPGYRHINEVLTKADLRVQYIESVRDEFDQFRTKLRTISDVADKIAGRLETEITRAHTSAKKIAEKQHKELRAS